MLSLHSNAKGKTKKTKEKKGQAVRKTKRIKRAGC